MTDRWNSLDRLAAESTQTRTAPTHRSQVGSVPALTLAWHPDATRVGERVALFALATGEPVELSRLAPRFAPPTGGDPYPLADRFLSRQPVLLTPGSEPGSVRIAGEGSGLDLEIDGKPLTNPTSGSEAVELSKARLDQGVTLCVSGRVVLVLHRLRELSPSVADPSGLVGESCAIRRVRSTIDRVAGLDLPVLLQGATGTGKELVARAIHHQSPRRDGPFVPLNMATLPPALAAAELFGAARGAYTGADRRRPGLFAEAEGGTLFLDEVGDTPPEVQAQLLRALETGEVRPVGGDTPRRVDVRLVSATDADLEAEIAADRFRAPLLHRLAGFEIRLPPLAERRDDIGRLLVHFLAQEIQDSSKTRLPETPALGEWLPADEVARLVAYDWPGNVRQLRNIARQIAVTNQGADPAQLPETVRALLALSTEVASDDGATPTDPEVPPRRRPAEISDDELVQLLRSHRFNVRAAAVAAGISPTSLYALIDKSSRLRKPADIDRAEIEASLGRAAGNVDRAALELEVSSLALKRRLTELGMR